MDTSLHQHLTRWKLSDDLKLQVCFLLLLWHPKGFYSTAHLSVPLIIIIIILSQLLCLTISRAISLFFSLCVRSMQSHLSVSLTPLSLSAVSFCLAGLWVPLWKRREAESSPSLSSGCLSFLSTCTQQGCVEFFYQFFFLWFFQMFFFKNLCHPSVCVFLSELLVLFYSLGQIYWNRRRV